MAAPSMKEAACSEIDKNADSLNKLSLSIWENPELNYEEKHAHEVLTNYLESQNFNVDRSYTQATAFRAVYSQGSGTPHIVVISEYDALPEIGHACGHNLIAEAGVAAGLGIKAALKASGIDGKVTVLGTPAEEGGGGKIDLINADVFDGVDAAMMTHPGPFTTAFPVCLCITHLDITYHGKASHAAGFPWDGINALDAAVLCYQNISCMRQQMKPSWRVHGIITNGGAKPNIIPEISKLEYYVRAPSFLELETLKIKIVKCVESAATATGCTVDCAFQPKDFKNVISNKTLGRVFEDNAKALGVEFTPEDKIPSAGSTDMGNVSYVVPSIHPIYYVGEDNCLNHTREFTAVAGSIKAQPYTLDMGKAMAMVAVDLYSSPDLLAKVKADFNADMQLNRG